ncbi:MAG: UDP-N-acetylmuramoyl-tripeptide--D-alanyl-D-alanine ligase [Bacteroides sp.]
MKLSALYQIFLDCSVVTTDSRNCPEDSLFIALKGESFNGNAFAMQALKDGCSYAVIDEPEYAIEGDNRFIVVSNCLETLQQLANHHRQQLGTRVIGITGTNGKTTTKELIAAVLSKSHNVLCTQGNFNNHIGVPLTLLRLKPEHTLAVIEMGANHPGEIKQLVDIVEPDYGIITNVGRAHLEGFGSFEGVMKTKGELYDYLGTKEDATVFVHHDDSCLMEMIQARKLLPIFYGSDESLYISGQVISSSPYLAFEWKAGKEDKHHAVQTQLIGEYNLANLLAAVTIGSYFGVEALKINEALTEYTPENNRSQLKKTADNTLIIDAYNANPTSMMAALENFDSMKMKHKMLILGDMRELGVESQVEHQKITDYIKKCSFAKVLLVGEHFSAINHGYKAYSNTQELIKDLQVNKPRNSTILIKGSNGIKLNTIVDYL